jgi:cob(I)alamin adenosyltransferase
MKVYTKTGDAGETGLFGGARVPKDDPRVEAYGSVDELNAVVGLARSFEMSTEVNAMLELVQAELFVVGAELACAAGSEDKLRMPLVDASAIERLEREIDLLETRLTPLKSFILPAGASAAAALHLARTTCRRAERNLVTAGRSSPLRAELLTYLNRLGDFLFVVAREANRHAYVHDVPWNPHSR